MGDGLLEFVWGMDLNLCGGYIPPIPGMVIAPLLVLLHVCLFSSHDIRK